MRVWLNLAISCGAALIGAWALGSEQLASSTKRANRAQLIDIDRLALSPHLETEIRARVGIQYSIQPNTGR